MPRAPVHLHPTAPLADRVLLPGDPGRALLLAQELLEAPKMFNHHRGLWGYTGAAKADGAPLTVQATGMGGPSAAIVLEELAGLGVTRAVRVGTAGALGDAPGLGDLVLAREALAADGTSRALGAGERAVPDAGLTAALEPAVDAAGTVVSTDVFYEPDAGRVEGWRAAGALAVDLEAAALFTVGARRGVAVACVLAVAGRFDGSGERLDEDGLRAASVRLGAAGAAALGVC